MVSRLIMIAYGGRIESGGDGGVVGLAWYGIHHSFIAFLAMGLFSYHFLRLRLQVEWHDRQSQLERRSELTIWGNGCVSSDSDAIKFISLALALCEWKLNIFELRSCWEWVFCAIHAPGTHVSIPGRNRIPIRLSLAKVGLRYCHGSVRLLYLWG